MEFVYDGSKTGNIFKVGHIFFLVAASLALLIFFYYSDWETISEYSLPILMIFGFFAAYVYHLFKQKSTFLEANISLEDDIISVKKYFNSKLEECKLIVLYEKNSFTKYILYDTNSNFSIYSNIEDEFYHKIKNKVFSLKQDIKSASIYNNEILLACNVDDKIVYNLESGTVDIQLKNIEETFIHPRYFYIDPNFK